MTVKYPNPDLIKYSEKDGKIFFSYKEEVKTYVNVTTYFRCEGEVPDHIVKKGEDAIKKYCERKVENRIKRAKIRHDNREMYEKDPNHPVSARYKGVELKGRIVSANHQTLVVRLETPMTGEKYVCYGWASAMVKHYIFNKRGKFSRNAIENAKRLLERIYLEEKHKLEHKDELDFVSRLNKK